MPDKCQLKKINAVIAVVLACGWLMPAGATAAELDEIVVTAQKREQNLQDVPISVQAVGGDILDDRNITSFENLEIPGVHIGQDSIVVRGIGAGGNRGFELSAPMFHDGVFLSRGRQQRLAFLDVERIEFLKGPQTTYLGKNAIAGAVNTISRRPTDEFEGTFEISNEFEHDEITVFTALSGPLSDNFRVRAAVKYRDIDGWIDNTANGRTGPAEEDKLFRISAEWDVSDTFQAFFKYERAEIDQFEGASQKTRCAPNDFIDPALDNCVLDGSRAVVLDEAGFPFARDLGVIPPYVSSGDSIVEFIENDAVQLILTWDIGGYELVSSTSNYSFDSEAFRKFDVTTFPVVIGHVPELVEQFSQEIRLMSPRDGIMDWLVGVYYDENDRQIAAEAIVSPTARLGFLGPQVAVGSHDDRESESLAIYGEIGFDLSDTWRATLGGRYSDVEHDGFATNTVAVITPGGPLSLPGFITDSGTKDTEFQPAVSLEWRPSDGTMLYASWKEGFKSGGPNARLSQTDAVSYGPEFVTSYEAGAKMTLLDGAATLNLAVFQSDFDDLQVQSLDTTTGLNFITQNAASASASGLEIDGAWAVSDNWTLFANVSVLNAEYDSFPSFACYAFPAQTAAQGCIIDPATNVGSQDLSGKPLVQAPDLSGSIAIEWNQPLAFGSSQLELSSRLDIFYTDDYQTAANQHPSGIQDSYSKIDLRVAIGPAEGPWSLAFIGRNLTDELTSHSIAVNGAAGSLSETTVLDRPRQIGLQFRYSWF